MNLSKLTRAVAAKTHVDYARDKKSRDPFIPCIIEKYYMKIPSHEARRKIILRAFR